jgi:hypothetical protein
LPDGGRPVTPPPPPLAEEGAPESDLGSCVIGFSWRAFRSHISLFSCQDWLAHVSRWPLATPMAGR